MKITSYHELLQAGREANRIQPEPANPAAKVRKQDHGAQLDMFSRGLALPTGAGTAIQATQILRSNLFGMVQKGSRKGVSGLPVFVASGGGIRIRMTYTGLQLDQSHHTTLLTLYQVLQQHIQHQITSLGTEGIYTIMETTATEILARMGQTNIGGKNRRILKRQLTELSASALSVTREDGEGQTVKVSHILNGYEYNDRRDCLIVGINREFIRLMAGGYSIIDWAVWLGLSGAGRTLYSLMVTHDKGRNQFMTVDQIKAVCGSEMKDNARFIYRHIKPALRQLEQAGIIDTGWTAQGGRVQWTRA